MTSPVTAEDSRVINQLSTRDRFLPVWILTAMAGGLLLGRVFDGFNDTLDTVQDRHRLAPDRDRLLAMMYPVLAKVKYSALGDSSLSSTSRSGHSGASIRLKVRRAVRNQAADGSRCPPGNGGGVGLDRPI